MGLGTLMEEVLFMMEVQVNEVMEEKEVKEVLEVF